MYLGRLRGEVGLGRRQGEVERCAPADLTLGPDATAVAVDHPVDRRQSDARAGELLFGVQPLERPKQLVGATSCRSRRRCRE